MTRNEALLSAIEDVAYAWARLEMAQATLSDAPMATLADECMRTQQTVGRFLGRLKKRKILGVEPDA